VSFRTTARMLDTNRVVLKTTTLWRYVGEKVVDLSHPTLDTVNRENRAAE
jgi:hypothetical protein